MLYSSLTSWIAKSLMVAVLAYEIPLPPRECIYEPTVPYKIVTVPHELVPTLCGQPYADGRHGQGLIMACTWTGYNLIIMPERDLNWLTDGAWYTILIHEKGHVNCGAWHP